MHTSLPFPSQTATTFQLVTRPATVNNEILTSTPPQLGLTCPPNPLDDPNLHNLESPPDLPDTPNPSHPTDLASLSSDESPTLRQLHTLLLETQITSGKLVCGNCGHEYKIMEGIPNFLLPAHLV